MHPSWPSHQTLSLHLLSASLAPCQKPFFFYQVLPVSCLPPSLLPIPQVSPPKRQISVLWKGLGTSLQSWESEFRTDTTSGPESLLLRAEQGRTILKGVDGATPGDHSDTVSLFQTQGLKSNRGATLGERCFIIDIRFFFY